MKKAKKILIITLSIIVVLVVAGIALYKPVYDFVAPKVFDHFVGKNLQKLIDNPEDNIKINSEDNSSDISDEEKDGKSEKKDGDTESDKEENKTESDKKTESNDKKKDVYKTQTHMGEMDEYDLNYILSVITPADKSRIVGIVKGCVARSDYPEMARRVKDGLDGADMAYIESYLRSHMTPNQKKQIMDIVKKYVKN